MSLTRKRLLTQTKAVLPCDCLEPSDMVGLTKILSREPVTNLILTAMIASCLEMDPDDISMAYD